MIICIGPICVPLWHVGLLLAFLFKPAYRWARRKCGYEEAEETSAMTKQNMSGNPPPDAPAEHTEETTNDAAGATLRRRPVSRVADSDGRGGCVDVHTPEEWQNVCKRASDGGLPIVLAVGASWCKPCKHIAPVFRSLAQQHRGLFVSVDVDEMADLAEEAAARALPTFQIWRPDDGRRVAKTTYELVGAVEASLRSFVADHCEAHGHCDDVTAN
ncbi:unnamed protein product [Vitrella brassicaformis CCMP3155]|uniref:Thioredoxin domain-containing protein n=2 Tax=Vitrella brassicaformis TaxID=1169539 RepID=A0A0G4GVY9_VITBC|nr:unnamed protein product [Vitrella brassicaformis CCMP3155]|eukprot:CEM34846.1 unnamed protein product [Vitrella brassicaformis CCMP3155]